MHKIGIFFGTDSGTTRLIAKKIARKLKSRLDEQIAAKPVNVNRIEADQLLSYQALILGTPTPSCISITSLKPEVLKW